MQIRRTYRYRLYRSKRDKHLVRQIELASEIWNWGVALTRRYYSIYGKYPGSYKIKRQLAKRKKRDKSRLKTFLTLSDGRAIESPQHLRASLKEMARLQRDLSRKQKGSNNRRKARIRVAKRYRRIADQRRDFHFKAARAVLEQHDFVGIEDLNLDGMKRLWGRKVSDLGFRQFVSILEHLARANGKEVVKVDRFFASNKTCHDCGHVNRDLTLADRRWVCRECGTEHDRDRNAANNIRDRALSHSVGDVRHDFHAIAA